MLRARLKPWHVLVVATASSLVLLGAAGDLRENLPAILVNMGTGILGAVLTFLLLNQFLPTIINADGRQKQGISYQEFASHVRTSRKRVRILSTFVYPLTSHPSYQAERKALVDALNHAIQGQGDLEVQVLLLDPFSDAAKQRDEERTDDDVILRIQENLSELHHLKRDRYYGQAFSKIQVKLYDRLPPLSIFQWDDRASMSFYPRYEVIHKTSRFEFAMDTPLGVFMRDTFENVWQDVKTIDLDDYMYLTIQIEHGVGQAHVRKVHFLEMEPSRFHVLLNVERDADTRSLLSMDAPNLAVGIVRGGRLAPCTCTRLRMSEDVLQRARRKYGAYDYQTIVELCV
jgi:hypothetical protein